MSAGTISTPKTRPTVVFADSSTREESARESVGAGGVEALKDAGESASHIAGAYASVYSDTLAAAFKSGTQVAAMLSDVSRNYADVCAASTSAMAEVARESLACRTPADFVALQKKSMDSLNAIVGASAKVYGGMFAACSKAAEPLIAGACDAPERLFRSAADFGGLAARAPGADPA